MSHVIYDWDDGSQISFSPSQSSRLSQFVLSESKGVVRLRMWWNPATRVLSTFPDGSGYGATVHPPILSDWNVKKLRGFILDAGFPRPRGSNLLTVDREDKTTDIAYPNWVEEERWDNRYSEVMDHVIQGRPPNDRDTSSWRAVGPHPIVSKDFLGYVENVSVFKDRFVSRSRGMLPFKFSWGLSMMGHELAATIEEVVNVVTAKRFLLPESNREQWEKVNVVRGEFIAPSPEEVEVFRILDEELPLLSPPREFEKWLLERSSS